MKKRSRAPKTLSSEYSAFRDQIQKSFKRKLRKEPKVIYDPMAGTAPLIPFIETNGHVAYLNDILPMHFFINKAKTYQVFQQYKQYGFDWYFQQLLSCMTPLEGKVLCISDKWIDDSILRGLIQAWHAAEQYDEDSATLLKAAILLCVRPFSSITKSNNPTWFKYGGISSGKDLREIVRDSLTRFDKYYHYHYKSSHINERGKCIITDEDATQLQLPQKVDFIMTSPPYCNRIDPVVQYGPENYFLSALGYTISEECLISITKVKDYNKLEQDFEYLTTKSKYACKLLTKIWKSKKADDPSYYLKYYTRYFAKLFQVIDNVLNNLSATGKMYVVTQDNTHRGERIQIDRILRELLRASGWRSEVIHWWPRHHQGLRHVYRSAFISPMQLEKLMVIWR
jgi:hypothetical protein